MLKNIVRCVIFLDNDCKDHLGQFLPFLRN